MQLLLPLESWPLAGPQRLNRTIAIVPKYTPFLLMLPIMKQKWTQQSIDRFDSECPKAQSMGTRTDKPQQTPTINRLISQTPRAQTIRWVDFSKPKTKHRNDFAAGQERGGGGALMNFQSPMLLFYRWECQSTRVGESKVSCWSLVNLEYMLLVPCALRFSLALSWIW